jgi:acyl dehydratase
MTAARVSGNESSGVVSGRDLRIGTRYDLGTHRMTETEIVAFATAWDPQAFHIDAEAAKSRHFGGIVASGLHTIGVYQRLATLAHLDRWGVIAGRGLRDLQFPRPVCPGTSSRAGSSSTQSSPPEPPATSSLSPVPSSTRTVTWSSR